MAESWEKSRNGHKMTDFVSETWKSIGDRGMRWKCPPKAVKNTFEGSKSFVKLHELATMREFGGRSKFFVEAQINLLNVEIYSSVVFR